MALRWSPVTSSLKTAAVALTAAMLLSGCFLNSLVGTYDGDGGVGLSGNIEVKRCEGTGSFSCDYALLDDGLPVEYISSFILITELGFLGIIIDPLIVQVPVSATDVTATYNDAGTPLPLVISETTSFPVTPSVTVEAEPDTKFLILELPDAVAAALPADGTQFDFTLDFVVTGPADFSVKPMLTASVDQDATRYYLPLLPCVTDFAQVPSVQLSQPTRLQDLLPQVRDLMVDNPSLGCDGTTYDLRTEVPAATAPTTTTTIAPTTTIPPTTEATTTTAVTTTVAPATVPAESTTPTTTIRITTQLPETGSATTTQLWVAMLLLALGAAVIWLSRRHPARP